MNKPWKLVIGIHRGTIMSRDASDSYHDSLEQCREVFEIEKRHYESMGCQIWFATAHGPDDRTLHISQGTPYN